MASIFKKIAKSVGSLVSSVSPLGWLELGTSIIGGLTQKKPKAEALGVDYQKLRDQAQAAGFNPLTALMYGGSQAYQYQYGPSISRVSNVAEAISDFARRQYDRQIEQDRLQLEKDYFGLEQQRVGMERTSLEHQISGAQYGPVFGPSSRIDDRGPLALPDHATYEETLREFGPVPAAMEGAGRYIQRAATNVGSRIFGSTSDGFSTLWSGASSLPRISPKPVRPVDPFIGQGIY